MLTVHLSIILVIDQLNFDLHLSIILITDQLNVDRASQCNLSN
jgi:ABC-type methionine transport system ATPase subunit